MSKVKLSKFSLFGTFCLNKAETVGIENLVQRLNDDKFLSRNANYYPNNYYLCFTNLYTEYERLNEMLPMSGKPAFVICEKMHELAIRTVNTIQQDYRMPLFQDGEHFDTVAQKCAQECADNLVRLIHDQPAERTATNLRDETRLRPESVIDFRIVEADNKKQLYMCANALPDDIEHLVTPGRGSSKLGTIVQSVRKQKGLKPLGFTQIYYSLYGNRQRGHVFYRAPKNLPEKLFVMDDDIDTGCTLWRIKKELTKQGHQVTTGAMIATFCTNAYGIETVFEKPDWAKYIDIIPNQQTQYNDQNEFNEYLKLCCDEPAGAKRLERIMAIHNRNGDNCNSADYYAMKRAERMASNLDADLYRASEKISPAAVAYNERFNEQVKKHNITLADSVENANTVEKYEFQNLSLDLSKNI